MEKNPAPSKSSITLSAKSAIQCIRFYQWIASPWLGNQCRFYPSCSHYSLEVFQRYGFIKGIWLTLKRLSKCHPWHSGGIDLPPEKFSDTERIEKTECTQHFHSLINK
jgi:putative membrane protein insertion efficiency factor